MATRRSLLAFLVVGTCTGTGLVAGCGADAPPRPSPDDPATNADS